LAADHQLNTLTGIFSFHFATSAFAELLSDNRFRWHRESASGGRLCRSKQRPDSEEEPQANLCLQGSDSKDLRVVAVVTARWTTRTTWSMIR